MPRQAARSIRGRSRSLPGAVGASGVRLTVEARGEGEPLVLIHGLATTRAIWDAVAPLLCRERRVVTLDVPGFGQSPPVGAGFELDAVAGAIADGLRAHGVEAPYDLVGHSLGAGIALTLAARRPGEVGRLIVVAPAGLTRLPPQVAGRLARGVDGLLAARRALAPLAGSAWGRRLLLGFAAADGARLTPAQTRAIVRGSVGARRTAQAFSTIVTADLRPLLRAAEVPLAALWGAADRTVPPRLAAVLREVRPDVEIALIERAGHVAMIERPQAFVDALDDLFRRLPKQATSSR